MRFILRIVAVLSMLLALSEALRATYDLFRADDKSADRLREDDKPLFGEHAPITPKPSFSEKVKQTCQEYTLAASLFCSGGILFVLIRISAAQEEDVRQPPATPAVPSSREQP